MALDRNKAPPPPIATDAVTKPPPPRRQRSLSTTSYMPAPLSPAFKLAEHTRTVSSAMTAYSHEREKRLQAVRDAWAEARQLGGEVATLSAQLAVKPNDLGLRARLDEVEHRRKMAKLREQLAKAALSSPSMQGPPSPSMRADIDAPDSRAANTFATSPPHPALAASMSPRTAFSASPPHFASPTSSRSASPVRPPAGLTRRPTRTSFSRAPFPAAVGSPSSSSRPPSPLIRSRPVSIAAPMSAPGSDPMHSFSSFPSRQLLITSRLAIPGFIVVQELGLVQVGTPHMTDLGAIKELLRVEGEKRGADAVLGVQTKQWAGEGGGLTAAGRAVKLRAA